MTHRSREPRAACIFFGSLEPSKEGGKSALRTTLRPPTDRNRVRERVERAVYFSLVQARTAR